MSNIQQTMVNQKLVWRDSNPDFPSLRFTGYDIDANYVEINRERRYDEQSTP